MRSISSELSSASTLSIFFVSVWKTESEQCTNWMITFKIASWSSDSVTVGAWHVVGSSYSVNSQLLTSSYGDDKTAKIRLCDKLSISFNDCSREDLIYSAVYSLTWLHFWHQNYRLNMVRLWTQKVRGTFWGLSAFYQQAHTLNMW